MPVSSDQLPFPLTRLQSEQPSASRLYFKLEQALGELPSTDTDAVITVTSSTLPLPLTRPLSDQPPANQLPFNLTRKLGALGSSNDVPVDPPTPTEPRRMVGAMMHMPVTVSDAVNVADDLQHCLSSQSTAHQLRVDRLDAVAVAKAQYIYTLGFAHLANAQNIVRQSGVLIHNHADVRYEQFVLLSQCQSTSVSAVVNYASYADVYSASVVRLERYVIPTLKSVINYNNKIGHKLSVRNVSQQHTAKVQRAVPVPCRYYPIPEPPPVKPKFTCRIRPPSNQLPFNLHRKRGRIPSSNLPFNLTCWHDQDSQPDLIPNLRSYIVLNVITATIGGITIDPLSFGIKTDMDSGYWQGNISITKKDYQRIKHKLNVERGSEPIVNAVINGCYFAFIIEDMQRTREFAKHTYSLSGRSITARLGADYAIQEGGLIEQSRYVSQIANELLNNTGFSIDDWKIPDWLVPGNVYSTADKTPIAVMADIAKACGGFVESDPSNPTLSLKPRWPAPAWTLATATPDYVLPVDVMRLISDNERTNPLFNTVALAGSSGGIVYRADKARNAPAPTQSDVLYTDRDAIISAGIAILSDSGKHGEYTLKARWADKYDIPLARLGKIWQINDPEGTWRGVVTGVSIDIGQSDNAPTVWQSVTLDRYLDN